MANTLKTRKLVFSSEREAQDYVEKHPGTTWTYDPIAIVWIVEIPADS